LSNADMQRSPAATARSAIFCEAMMMWSRVKIDRLSMVGCGWYWKKAGGVDELGMLEMNGTPSSIPSAYIGTRARSPLTPGLGGSRVTEDGTRILHAFGGLCIKSPKLGSVCGEGGYLLTLTIRCQENYCGPPNLQGVERNPKSRCQVGPCVDCWYHVVKFSKVWRAFVYTSYHQSILLSQFCTYYGSVSYPSGWGFDCSSGGWEFKSLLDHFSSMCSVRTVSYPGC
jgi:hypothetical protein